MIGSCEVTAQGTLIEVVDNDDKILLNSPKGQWYKILANLPWVDYLPSAVEYYDSLYDFNKKAEIKRETKKIEASQTNESKEEAEERLLFERVTMQESPSDEEILYHKKFKNSEFDTVKMDEIAPGKVPLRLAGKKPKCFFSLLKSFIGATLMGFPAEPDKVYLLLETNPAFMRVCEFAPKYVNDEYCYRHLPSLRKLEQFDQIMSEYGIWNKIKIREVTKNFESGIIKIENEIVGDTTHYHAYSGFETITYIDENDKEQRKSQSKVVKKCNCPEKKTVNTHGS